MVGGPTGHSLGTWDLLSQDERVWLYISGCRYVNDYATYRLKVPSCSSWRDPKDKVGEAAWWKGKICDSVEGWKNVGRGGGARSRGGGASERLRAITGL